MDKNRLKISQKSVKTDQKPGKTWSKNVKNGYKILSWIEKKLPLLVSLFNPFGGGVGGTSSNLNLGNFEVDFETNLHNSVLFSNNCNFFAEAEDRIFLAATPDLTDSKAVWLKLALIRGDFRLKCKKTIKKWI